ncbi:hypothetical protein D9611_007605 [Ephemerocybe angulata]|uniref:HAT C-terminal dimerisation domain-containing protein n=1 Tax=Ephemerocybe angulata TaxID=980116 RepID=A0A8H5BYV2_9AGAR|nr:hypothetical protein D9611_007605 [Tulosesus angulatus]
MHITRYHYDAYFQKCKLKSVEAKAPKPEGWQDSSVRDPKKQQHQQSITGYTEAKLPPRPKVSKVGMLQYLIELLIDADLSFRFVNRPSEAAQKYFELVCGLVKILMRKFKLWVCTRWGSLSDCFETALALQPAIDRFCVTADYKTSIPPLRNGKTWNAYRMKPEEWTIIHLSHRVLKVAANMHSQLSADRTPTLQRVYPVLESLMSQWETMAKDPEFSPIKEAIEAGLANLVKWYKSTDNTALYFIAHFIDPVRKDKYVCAVWEDSYVDAGLEKFQDVFSQYKAAYNAEQLSMGAIEEDVEEEGVAAPNLCDADAWMDHMIKTNASQSAPAPDSAAAVFGNTYAELNCYLAEPIVKCQDCPDPVAWWGNQGAQFPILHRIAQDYLAVPASSALIEHAFSMSARTDDPRRGNLGEVKFGVIQRLRDVYREGRLEAIQEAWLEIDPNFDFSAIPDDIEEILELE